MEIYLWEEDSDRAWAAAHRGRCLPKLWMKLAEMRAVEHPEDALSVYLPRIEPLINQTSNEDYLKAVDLLV